MIDGGFRPEDAYLVDLPPDPPTPVVVSVPHAGSETGLFQAALAAGFDVRCDADLFVDRLYEGAPLGPYLRARLSRFVCDLNRHPDDVSPRAVPQHPGPRNQDGRGFVWEVNTTGARALARPLSYDEWDARRAIHAAYHGVLTRTLEAARAKFGFAILVDGHSMPSIGKQGHSDSGRTRAEIVPGDREGASCSSRLSAVVGEHFRTHGFSVAFNDPYKGGFITQHHGRPKQAIHAIQIEMRRDLYMDETRFSLVAEKADRIRSVLAELLRKLDTLDLR